MSRIIDTIAIAGATLVTGYFIYRVILPNIKDLQLPTFQFLPFPQFPFQWPQQQQQPQQQTGALPPAAPPPAAGGLLYDSNTMGKWNNGQSRTISNGGEGGQGANGKGLHTAASGNPTFTIDGNGVAHLTSSRFGRIYIYANNYNARLEGNLMFEKTNLPGDDISFKIRSRHGNNGHPIGGGSECGGVGASFGADGTVKLKIEPEHGTNNAMSTDTKTTPPVVGKWYKFSFSVWDAGGVINSKFEIDGKVVNTGKIAAPTQCADQSLFNKESYFWIRLNSADEKTPIKAAFSNIRLYNLGSTSVAVRNLILNNPQYYYGYVNRRRA